MHTHVHTWTCAHTNTHTATSTLTCVHTTHTSSCRCTHLHMDTHTSHWSFPVFNSFPLSLSARRLLSSLGDPGILNSCLMKHLAAQLLFAVPMRNRCEEVKQTRFESLIPSSSGSAYHIGKRSLGRAAAAATESFWIPFKLSSDFAHVHWD